MRCLCQKFRLNILPQTPLLKTTQFHSSIRFSFILSVASLLTFRLFIITVMFERGFPREKQTDSSKKMHRRVMTEIQDQSPVGLYMEYKKSDKLTSRPKFLDVYSKQVPKDSQTQRRNFKINMGKPAFLQKHMRTQTDGAPSQKPKNMMGRFQIEGVAGKGTFGVVYFGIDGSTGERVAIKKVFQDKKYKNRQHQILKLLSHPNNLLMKESFISSEGQDEYLNIVMDYFSDNLYQVIKKKEMSPLLVKLYAYQIFRGLNYLAMLSIAHRDIKPQNILVDRTKHKVIVSDFGSAKQLTKGQANLAYICSRCYRAPELIFGATDYTAQIDMWSTGCVLVEMINGNPPFMGDSQIEQLIEIIKILGTPTKQEVQEMNRMYDMKEYIKFPKVKTTPWKNLVQTRDPMLLDLITRVLQYSPIKRITPAQALQHEYFDELRSQAHFQEMLFKIKAVPQLFDFSQEQLQFIYAQTKSKFELVPHWCSKKLPTFQLSMNKISSSTTNTKRSIISYKAL